MSSAFRVQNFTQLSASKASSGDAVPEDERRWPTASRSLAPLLLSNSASVAAALGRRNAIKQNLRSPEVQSRNAFSKLLFMRGGADDPEAPKTDAESTEHDTETSGDVASEASTKEGSQDESQSESVQQTVLSSVDEQDVIKTTNVEEGIADDSVLTAEEAGKVVLRSQLLSNPYFQSSILGVTYLIHMSLEKKTALENVLGGLWLAYARLAPADMWEGATGGGLYGQQIRSCFTNVSKVRLIVTTAMLFASERLSGPVGDLVYRGLVATGLRVTEAQDYAIQVLASFLPYAAMCFATLGMNLKGFFPEAGDGSKDKSLKLAVRRCWLPWVLGGYYGSHLLSNSMVKVCRKLYDIIAYFVEDLPNADSVEIQAHLGDQVIKDIVAYKDASALFMSWCAAGFIAPFLEEVLYRGFLMPALMRFLPRRGAMAMQSFIFGAVHRAQSSFLPLSLLGYVWGRLYMASGNLFVPVLVHAMWNSRSFAQALVQWGRGDK